MPSSHSPIARVLATLILAVLSLGGCTQDGTATAPTSSPVSSPTVTPNFLLLIHCGIRYASFDGDTWEAVAPIPSIAPSLSDGKGNMSSRNEIAGQMVRLSPTEARFTTTDDPAGLVVHFVRSTATMPLCA